MGSPDDKILEGRLFDLLEERAGIRLGDLARLRRQSRARGVLLLDVAYQEGRLSPELAEAIASESGIEWFLPGPVTSSVDGGDSESSMFEDTMDSIIDGPPPEMNVSGDQRGGIDRIEYAHPPHPSAGSGLLGMSLPGQESESADLELQANSIRQRIRDSAENISALVIDRGKPLQGRLTAMSQSLGEALRHHGSLLILGRARSDDQEHIEKLISDVVREAQKTSNLPLVQCLTSLLEPTDSPDVTGEAGPIHAVLDVKVQGQPCTIEILDLSLEAGLVVLNSRRVFDSAERVLVPLDPGSYILRCREADACYAHPFTMNENVDVTLDIRAPHANLALEYFALIPAGKVHLGADALAWQSLGPRDVFLGEFLLGREPVTCGEYKLFLNALAESHGLEVAMNFAPQVDDHGGSAWPVIDGRFVLPESDRHGIQWNSGLPIVGVDYEDACRYCAWLDTCDGPGHRLPTEDEWEKAAGSDYAFPWGHRWNAEFCHTRKGTGGTPVRAPGTKFSQDESIYGVRGLAGGVSEWTASPSGTSTQRVVKGGHWASGTIECRTASRFAMDMDTRCSTLGFRVARHVPSEN